jgi:hypothetical protein
MSSFSSKKNPDGRSHQGMVLTAEKESVSGNRQMFF